MVRKKIMLKVFLLLVASLLIVSCSKQEAKKIEKNESQYEWPKSFLMTVSEVGSSSQAAAAAVNGVLEESTGMKVRSLPESTYERLFVRVGMEEVDAVSYLLGTAMDSIQSRGESAAVQSFPLWTIWPQRASTYGVAVRGNSDINTMADLKKKGLKVGNYFWTPQKIWTEEILPIFAGVTPEWAKENWIIVDFDGYVASVRALGEGRIDVMPGVGPESSVTMEMSAGAIGIRFIDQDFDNKEAWEYLAKRLPDQGKAVHSTGVTQAHGKQGHSLGGSIFISSGLIEDEEFQYQLAKWYHENYDLYNNLHPSLSFMHIDKVRDLLDSYPLPIAPGTKKYLREIGVWTVEDDKWFDSVEDLMMKYVEASTSAHAEAKEKKITPSLENKEWLDLLNSYKVDLPALVGR